MIWPTEQILSSNQQSRGFFGSVTANINEHLGLNVVRVKWCYRLQWITVDDMMFGDFTPSDGLL